MTLEAADGAAALALFQKLAAPESAEAAARLTLLSEFFAERSLHVERFEAEPSLPALVVRSAAAESLASSEPLGSPGVVEPSGAAAALRFIAPLTGQGAPHAADLAAFAALFAALARDAARPLAFVALAEDGAGRQRGARALAEAHPELLKASGAVLTPSPERPFDFEALQVFPLVAAFKGRARITLSAAGEPASAGHPSPAHAACRLTRGVLRLCNQPLPVHLTAEARRMFYGLRRASGPFALNLLGAGPRLADMAISGALADRPLRPALDAALRNTVAPLDLALDAPALAGDVPAAGRATLDARLLPGQEVSHLLFELRAILDDAQLELSADDACSPKSAPTDTPLFQSLARAIAAQALSARLVPWVSARVPDAALFGRAGAPLYGLPLAGDPAGDELARTAWLKSIEALLAGLTA